MSHILVTMLGKAASNYREATYAFDGGSHRTSRFFGLELCKHIRPDKLVILGTTGSMWDNLLLETALSEQVELEEALLTLGEAAQQDKVQQATLDQLAIHLQAVLGISCELRLIPYGRTQPEQTATLEILVNCFADNDTATLDVTHGLRHLPMLVQQSALLLQTLKDVQIAGIYYGALDLTQADITPVMRLDGLLEIDRWTEALTHYDKTGDYAVFVTLLRQSGISQAAVESLQDAAFYEQTNNVHQARGKLRDFLSKLREEESRCSRHAVLFLPALKQRFAWVNEDKLHLRQTAVAWLALEHGNLLRACIYGFEAFITKLTQEQGGKPDSFDERKYTKDQYETRKPSATWSDYKLLREIRNQLAHSSTQRNADVVKAVSNRAELTRTLHQIFTTLIPKTHT
ncbi:TIGR02221 family CRISPR-associated protein [Thiothrix subterranea]|uniref:TIGR02221 family CRISPR-associated protein n=1 Tax=Thiothrix subterranea TaxID=2735563 RepID=A0AA51MNF4_9GAMM|nr:TIGR02221 family CRISPR-associated protein [Thiothrix subterranea]MDQ5768351.1 TIGR02221 family CRISPR-associated protein [Thiothrix subterranea]QQZ28376.1 TIGR02221 family CRISPR-associated protein [Thiothrix subterranea]WML86939.1 TIGR02221 family CRISPR-associated protein [Thiothrix subterranea]